MSHLPPFAHRRVVDLSSSLGGSYCARLLADLGAAVWKVEPPEGHPLRHRMWAPPDEGRRPGALFRHLAAGHRSVVVDPHGPREPLVELVRAADAVLWSPGGRIADMVSPEELRRLAPHAVVCALSDFGLDGPWAGRQASELVLQAWAGAIAGRGAPDQPPVHVGGELGEWMAGMFGAVAIVTSWFGDRQAAPGDLLDVSKLEALAITATTMYPVTFASVMGRPYRHRRATNVPDVHRARDGWVGFMCVTGQQLIDFLNLVERPDWADDHSLLDFWNRDARRDELLAWIDGWVGERSVEEVLELAEALRIPAAPIGTGETIPGFEHLRDRGFLREGWAGEFIEPAPTFWCSAYDHTPPPAPAPELGADAPEDLAATGSRHERGSVPRGGGLLPFEGLRVLDFTAFWAGPIVGNYLALLGADVIKVESPVRLDGTRYQSRRSFDEPDWWEWSGLYQGANGSKRSLTLDMGSEAGRAVAERLVASSDVVIENFSPRVLDSWGFGYERLRELRDDVILVRMPAYGVEGPWRDRTGYAQTMEMVSGMAWMTGHEDAPPTVPNGPCDPIAGMHATLALVAALEHRRRTGEGCQVVSPMIGGALRVCAEQLIEASAYGHLPTRSGNRSPAAAPQGLYLAADRDGDGRRDRWVAISVTDDAQWLALRRALGDPAWAADPALATGEGRRHAHDAIDARLDEWCAGRSSAEAVRVLVDHGVPAAVALLPHEAAEVDQLRARGFFETVQHPLLGDVVLSGYPVRSARFGPWSQAPAPMLGQHNHEVLVEVAGCSEDEVAALEEAGVVGGEPATVGGFTA